MNKTKVSSPEHQEIKKDFINTNYAGINDTKPCSDVNDNTEKVISQEDPRVSKSNDAEGVIICSCLESESLEGLRQCSQSDQSTIHLNMYNVAKMFNKLKD